MASNSPNESGLNNNPQSELQRQFSAYNDKLFNCETELSIFEIRLQRYDRTINRLAEQHRDPINAEMTLEELEQSENEILPDWERIQAIHDFSARMTASLADTHAGMTKFWLTLDQREGQLMNQKLQHRQNIVRRLLEQRNHAEKKGIVNMLESRVAQCEANIQTLKDIKLKCKEIMQRLQSFMEAQGPISARLQLAMPLVERNMMTVKAQRRRIAEELGAAMNE